MSGEFVRGEFTRKFDSKILRDEDAAVEEKKAQDAKLRAADDAVEAELQKLLGLVDHRAKWLKDRFPHVTEPASITFRGRHFDFPKTDQNANTGWLEFRARLNDSQMGILLEAAMEIPGRLAKKNDYITFPKHKADLEKAKKFLESKLFEFAEVYHR